MSELTVDELRERQIRVYRELSLEITGHYNREDRVIDEYQGRQLLELLQNADDAAQNKDIPYLRKIRFCLQEEGLFIANTGLPFSQRGLESLGITDRSPKQLDSEFLIGFKGLGFRSILSWSKSPMVLSQSYAFCFDPAFAQQEALKLAEEIPELHQEMQTFYQKTGVYPVPVLRFPKLPDPQQLGYSQAQQILADGYDTVIFLPLEKETVREQVKTQLCDLWGESLIFCRNLEEMQLEMEGKSWRWSISREFQNGGPSLAIIESHFPANPNSELSFWRIVKNKAELPESFSVKGKIVQRNFEIAVALNESGEQDFSEDSYLSKLHVFFPTRLNTGLSLLLHASLALTDSRNNLIPSPANQYILTQLVDLVFQVLEDYQREKDPYAAFQLIYHVHSCDSELKNPEIGFYQACKHKLREALIFHTFERQLQSLDSLFLPESFALYTILDPKYFPTLLYPPSGVEIYDALKNKEQVAVLPRADFILQLVNQCRQETPAQVGKILAQIVQDSKFSSGSLFSSVPEILRDQTGRAILPNQRVFILPEKMDAFSLPDWANLCFLHPELLEAFKELSGIKTNREAVSRLNDLGFSQIHEYNLSAIIEFLYDESHLTTPNLTSTQQVLDVLALLFQLFRQEKIQRLDAIKALDQRGHIIQLKQTYLGAPYPQGLFLQAYFQGQTDVHFVAAPETLLLTGSRSEIEAFLSHLGVQTKIKMNKEELRVYSFAPSPYLKAFFERQTYPLSLHDYHAENPQTFQTPKDFQKAIPQHLIEFFHIPDKFEQALKKAEPETILAFILQHNPDRFSRPDDEDGKYYYCYGSKKNYRTDPSVRIPNYLYFLLTNTPWLKGKNGQCYLPRGLKLKQSGKSDSGLFTHEPLELNWQNPFLKGVSKAAVKDFLKSLGVVSSFEEISSPDLYLNLLAYPEKNPSGEDAPWLYRKLIDAEIQIEVCAEQEQFFQSGQLWAFSRGQAGYFPVADCRYNSQRKLPKSLEKIFPIPLLELEQRKSSSSRILSVLGVKELTEKDYVLELDESQTQIHSRNLFFSSLLRERICYVLAYRLGILRDPPKDEIICLSQLQIQICLQFGLILTCQQEQYPLLMKHSDDFIWIPGKDKHSLLLLNADSEEEPQPGSFIWIQFAEGLADALRVPGEADTFAQILGSAQPERVLKSKLGETYQSHLKAAQAYLSQVKQSPKKLKYFAPKKKNKISPSSPTLEEIDSWLEQQEPNSVDPSPEEPYFQGLDEQIGNDKEREPSEQRADGENGLEFVPRNHAKRTASSKRSLVITSEPEPKAVSKRGMERLGVSEDETLAVAERFELNQNRFPVRVSHLRGSEAFGCDIISFSSQDDAQSVSDGQEIVGQIERWIEVKGSTQSSAEVKLTENENSKAQDVKEKYYIYRVYKGDEYYRLSILNNPYYSDAKTIVYDLSKSESTQVYDFDPHFKRAPQSAAIAEND
ncbi:MAG: sacsin N-terminal ATP-binding-like domain-containing protein [Candidatus Sericytochromatia bacterium]